MPRPDGRANDELRTVSITRGWLDHAEGSVLVEYGKTRVLCAASVTEGVPRWRKGSGLGWVTAEYAMLPRATHDRSDRESVKGRIGGRTHEISRLVGRSLRAAIDLKALGENTIVLDCDVLQADGGTRTAAITGAYVALHDACEWLRAKGSLAGAQPLVRSVSAISVGIIDGEPRLDLCYEEDVRAETDMNVVCTGDGEFIEVQGTAEGAPFTRGRARRAARPRRRRLPRPDPAAERGPRSALRDRTGGGRPRCDPACVLATRNAGKVRRAAPHPRGCRARHRAGRHGRSSLTYQTFSRPAPPSPRTRCSRRGRCTRPPGWSAVADDSGLVGRRAQRHARHPVGALGRTARRRPGQPRPRAGPADATCPTSAGGRVRVRGCGRRARRREAVAEGRMDGTMHPRTAWQQRFRLRPDLRPVRATT